MPLGFMQTSVLRFPKADRFIRIHESLMAACQNNACAAALVTFFEGWHNYKLIQKPYTGLYNQMATDIAAAPIIDVSGWQYHTNAQLEAGVMIYKIDTINRALELLEKLEFVSVDVPEHLTMLHKTGRTRWFLLRADKVNEWFDEYQQKTRPAFVPRLAPKRDLVPQTVTTSERALTVFNYWRIRLDHPRAVADPKRLTLINDLLKLGFSVLDLCLAIEGCTVSPHHQGQNDRNTVYDRIELIFKDASNVERFIKYATDAKVDPVAVQARLDHPAQITAATKPISPATAQQYMNSIVGLVVPVIVSGAPDENVIRQLRAMTRGNADMIKSCLAHIEERIEATEGMFTAEHATRLDALIKAI